MAGNNWDGKRTGEERRECKREIENKERRDRVQEKTGGEKERRGWEDRRGGREDKTGGEIKGETERGEKIEGKRRQKEERQEGKGKIERREKR